MVDKKALASALAEINVHQLELTDSYDELPSPGLLKILDGLVELEGLIQGVLDDPAYDKVDPNDPTNS